MDVQIASWIEWVDGRIEQMRDFILDTVVQAFGELLDKEHARAAGVVRKVLVATLMPDGFSRARRRRTSQSCRRSKSNSLSI